MKKLIIFTLLFCSCQSKESKQINVINLNKSLIKFEELMQIDSSRSECHLHDIDGTYYICSAVNKYGFPIKYTCVLQGFCECRPVCSIDNK